MRQRRPEVEHVHRQWKASPSLCFDSRYNLRCRFQRSQAHGDVGASMSQGHGDGSAQSPGSSGDQRDLPLQTKRRKDLHGLRAYQPPSWRCPASRDVLRPACQDPTRRGARRRSQQTGHRRHSEYRNLWVF
jgi:hypothetical protein